MDPKKIEQLGEIKKEIKAMIISNKSKMTVADLSNEYYNAFGKRLNGKEFGYRSMYELITKECNDILKIEVIKGIHFLCPILTTESGKMLNSLILKQKSSKAYEMTRSSIIKNKPNSNTQGFVHKTDLKLSRISKHNKFKVFPLSRSFNKMSLTEKLHTQHNIPADLPTKTKSCSIIANKPNSNTQGSFNKMNLTEKLNTKHNTPANLPIEPKPLHDFWKRDVENSNDVEENIRQLIEEHKKLRASEFLLAYFLKFKKKLDLEKLGFSNITSLCKSFPEIFAVKELEMLNDWMIYDQNTNHEDDFNTFCEKRNNKVTHESRDVSLDTKIFGLEALPHIDVDPSLVPENCIYFGHKINLAKPPVVDSNIEIYVAEVVDPLHFYFHIKSVENNVALDVLMSKLDLFYKSHKESYKMTRAQMKPGQYCVVKYSNLYHRAVILRNINENLLRVRYIDYGTIDDVSADDIRLLLKEYGKLEAQALPARLSNVEPLDHIWSHRSRERFLELVSNVTLSANIISVEQEIISVLSLTDKNEEIHTSISQILFEEGLVNISSSNKIHYKHIENLYLLPTFEDLESGYFPQFVDYKNNSEIAILFEKLFSSFWKIINEKISLDVMDTTISDVPSTESSNKSFLKFNSNHSSKSSIILRSENFEESQIMPRLPNANVPKNFESSSFQMPNQMLPNAIPNNFVVGSGHLNHMYGNPYEFHAFQNRNTWPAFPQYNPYPQINSHYYPQTPYNTMHNPYMYSNFNENLNQNMTVAVDIEMMRNNSPQFVNENVAFEPENGMETIDKSSTIAKMNEIPCALDQVDFKSINRISTPKPLKVSSFNGVVNEDLRSRFKSLSVHDKENFNSNEKLELNLNKNNSINGKIEKNSDFIVQENLRSRNYLTLLAIEEIIGFTIEIWRTKHMDSYIDSTFVVLEQVVSTFVVQNETQNILNHIYTTDIKYEVFYANNPQFSFVRNVITNGISKLKVGDKVMYDSLTKEISNETVNVSLLNLDHLIYFLKCYHSVLKIRYPDIVRHMLPLLKKYIIKPL